MNANTTFKALAFIVMIAVLLFGGVGITGAAAQNALPGDALYPVKTTIEQTRLSLAQDAGDRAQMKLAFAEQRLTEISGLIREGRYREIPEAVLAFEANINAALVELDTVSKADPARAAQIAQQVTSALTSYAQTLSELAANAPDSVRSEVTRALDTTQIVNGLRQSSDDNSNDDNGNDNVNDDNGNDDNSNSAVNDDNGNDDVNDDNGNGAVSDDNSNDNVNDDNGNDDNSNDDNSNESLSDDNGSDDNSNDSVSGGSSSDDNGNDDNSNGAVSDDNGNDDNGNDDSSGSNSGSGSDDDSDDDSSGKGSGKDDND